MEEDINFTKDVFISYSTMDSDEVLEFVSLLKNSGIDFFLDKMDIGWGESIVEKVFAGIETSRFVIVFISENSLQSNWVKKEIETAFHREVDTGKITLLPIISCSPNDFFNKYPFLRSKKYLEIQNKEIILQNLITLLRGEPGVKFVFNHQRSYHGSVWIRLLAKSENHNEKHNVCIRWGPWYRECTLELSKIEPLFLTHSKGDDNESIPININIDKATYVMVGQGTPNSERRRDINPFWVDAKSQIKKWIAKTFLWPK